MQAIVLQAAAWALDQKAGTIESAGNRVAARVAQAIDGGAWRGPAADDHRRRTDARAAELRRAAADMRLLARRFRARADQLAEEDRRRAAQTGAH
jgi:uncharacterized protein YukE